jgi:hypothetical protein
MGDGQDGRVGTAVKLILAWEHREEAGLLPHAVSNAYVAALRSIEADLEHEHLPELDKRHQEMVALGTTIVGHDPEGPPPDDAWWLMLMYLDPGQQRLLQASYEDLRGSLEAGAIYEDDAAGAERAQAALNAIAPAEELLAELPHTTFARPSAPDDHDERRRTLSVEIERQSDLPMSPVRVEWLDGYQSRVAVMELHADDRSAWWQLDIDDPPPGRGTQLELLGGDEGATLSFQGKEQTPDPRTGARLQRKGSGLLAAAAERELEKAIAWGTHELGDGFSLVRDD